jgi:hypothetical protein
MNEVITARSCLRGPVTLLTLTKMIVIFSLLSKRNINLFLLEKEIIYLLISIEIGGVEKTEK